MSMFNKLDHAKFVELFNASALLEKIVAEAMSRMTDFSTLNMEQVKIEHDLIDSDLVLDTKEATLLREIAFNMVDYPVSIHMQASDPIDATVNMLVNDREVPLAAFAKLREVVDTLAKKNNLVLLAEPNAPVHIYDINPSDYYPSGMEELSMDMSGFPSLSDPAGVLTIADIAASMNPFHLTGGGARGQMFSQLEVEEKFAKPLKGDAVYDWETLRKEVEATGMKLHPIMAHAPLVSHRTMEEGMRSLIPVRAVDDFYYSQVKKTPTPVSGSHVSEQEMLNWRDVSKLHATLTAQARATSGYGENAPLIDNSAPNSSED